MFSFSRATVHEKIVKSSFPLIARLYDARIIFYNILSLINYANDLSTI